MKIWRIIAIRLAWGFPRFRGKAMGKPLENDGILYHMHMLGFDIFFSVSYGWYLSGILT